MLILGAREVRQVLDGAEAEVLAAVRRAYLLHDRGRTALPHSVFLRFPDGPRNRIIGLPAYLGEDEPVAGIKWIASFPGNTARGLERASAAVILNSMATGQPEALLEGSVISARRTAASAALAAAALGSSVPETGASLIGCGVIGFEILAYLRAALPDLAAVTVFDLDRSRAEVFAARCRARWPELKTQVAESAEEALAAHRLVCLATTAAAPHLTTDACRPGTLVLHVSLRDLTPESILTAVNVVDDADHVCRESTSLHLAEQLRGDRDFIAASIGSVLNTKEPFRRPEDRVTVFSPFGLGTLDLALADLVRRRAEPLGLGTRVPDFLPDPAGAASG
ncbi:2,3-diaminopropionate biosynthesis protein SbnB [Streptomyces minutiscleroticus]|uniref:2,3-diaminopropionate biosynthesis protein SbnB n=1 Tax=Streptomyces minutiscleroticus TaxID=68238 RepID=A0A918NSG7_9ACTN|nr:2,3-diaminopropionate biosynthesis protein SbnB [Streptomyces minutiscleroticus]GGX92353.1 2,3-diaminopropionate biosynthesis protein SbnB [Streptomyces minutiscleroticus]